MEPNALASLLVDEAIAAAMVPVACPCDFGPGGRYRLEELVTPGRRSHVYRATDRVLSGGGFEACVAVKIMHDGESGRHEAVTARRIAHPNVLGVIDRGVEGEAGYVVTEYIDGGDLSERPGPWPPRRAAEFMAKVARGVQAAHSAGVVHCDLKPANVLLTAAGEPKLADFDLAWSPTRPTTEARGNAAFMSPEQFRDDENALSPPSDIYALGGLLFWLLTGRLPNGSDAEEVARTHRERAGAPSPRADRVLDRICQRAMAPRREDRPHSAGELADDLERWLNHEPIAWMRPGPLRRAACWVRRRPFRAAAIAATLFAAGAGLSAWAYASQRERAHRLKAQEDTIRMTNERVEAVRAGVRNHIRLFAQTALGGRTNDLQDRILPTLVWIDWLVSSPLIAEDGAIPSAQERIAMLRVMVDSSEADGRRGHLDDVLARYALAYFLADAGEVEEPAALAAEVREIWGERSPPEDPFWESLRGVEQCVAANRLARAGQSPAPVLTAALSELTRSGRAEPARRLIERAAVRLAPK